MKNLRNSFPEKSEKEIHNIAKTFYSYFTDLFVEMIKSFSLSNRQLERRVVFENPELGDAYFNKDIPIVVALGHYCNWEWLGLRASQVWPGRIGTLYRKLKNPTINQLMKSNRSRFGLKLISEQESKLEIPFLLKPDGKKALAFIADQSARPDKAIWVNFLHRKTAFVYGPEYYAKRFDRPVLYCAMHKVKRGYYSIRLSVISNHVEEEKKGEIIQKFANCLEEQIKQKPENWLWTHRRWKHKFPNSEKTATEET